MITTSQELNFNKNKIQFIKTACLFMFKVLFIEFLNFYINEKLDTQLLLQLNSYQRVIKYYTVFMNILNMNIFTFILVEFTRHLCDMKYHE